MHHRGCSIGLDTSTLRTTRVEPTIIHPASPSQRQMGEISIPDDIWHCVASFIPYGQLTALVSVNRALYNIVLDAKYQEVHWTKPDGGMNYSLARLSNPSIASRVRRLHVRAWFIEYLVRKDSLMSLQAATSRWWMWWPPAESTSKAKSSSFVAHEMLQSMTAAVRLMTHVTEYSFEWRDLSLTPDTRQFLTAARAAFGASLRKLTLHAQLAHLTHLISTVDYHDLEDLELYFDHDGGDVRAEALVAPFVNHFRHSLGSLLISSASKTDLSPLFYAFTSLPHLHRFTAHVPFDTAHLSDPGALVHVLHANSNTLSSVELGRAYAAPPDEAPDVQSTWPRFSTALVAHPSVLLNLTTLKMPLLETFDATITCLRRSADTLTSLYLVDYFLTEGELAEIAQIFAHRAFDTGLQRLHIGVGFLTLPMFDLLASRLPGLRSLDLVLSGATVSQVTHDFDTNPTAFCLALGQHQFRNWGLRELGIWEKRFADTADNTSVSKRLADPQLAPTRQETALMEHFASRIQSVRTLRGQRRSESGPRCITLRHFRRGGTNLNLTPGWRCVCSQCMRAESDVSEDGMST
ncbi:hypothetical protein C8R44DRAFT_781590 [Mycena epipterygia]|nr:hypothetical protein C8R44DRAFT_781590 [Mycena epipterygia]